MGWGINTAVIHNLQVIHTCYTAWLLHPQAWVSISFGMGADFCRWGYGWWFFYLQVTCANHYPHPLTAHVTQPMTHNPQLKTYNTWPTIHNPQPTTQLMTRFMIHDPQHNPQHMTYNPQLMTHNTWPTTHNPQSTTQPMIPDVIPMQQGTEGEQHGVWSMSLLLYL